MVYSKNDPAGVNIASHLAEHIPFKSFLFNSQPALIFRDLCLIEVEQHLIDLELAPNDVEWVLCLSRHKSASGKKCLTAHSPGNPTNSAQLGGKPNSIAFSNPILQSALICELKQIASASNLELQVTVEATHHGPTEIPYPVTFVEIGSEDHAWGDPTLGEAVSKAVTRSIMSNHAFGKVALGIGGGHYSEKFTNLIISGKFAFGHILPKYVLTEKMDRAMIELALKRTYGGCNSIVVDWKGTPSAFKDYIKQFAIRNEIELEKI
ncbi:MAG: hypothetical protein LUP94_02255 [Candidatus Methanomethylicus sp.]|nr:hypothetical protein [Candidatus Methanomethylicus sp.]